VILAVILRVWEGEAEAGGNMAVNSRRRRAAYLNGLGDVRHVDFG
jgi:hypothetical protein